MERTRVSTPVRKARKESVMFVSPELEEQHIPDEDTMDGSLTQTYLVTPKTAHKRRAAQADIRLTMSDVGKLSIAQWNKLVAFWEHDTFVRLRYVGILLSLGAFVCSLVSIPSEDWVKFEGRSL